MLHVVDGMNVLASRPDGWWRDRSAAMRRFAREVDSLAAGRGGDWLIVFDGRPRALDGLDRVTVEWAPRRGRNAADDRIVEIVGERDQCIVYTSDRELRDRAAALGAEIRSAGALLALLGAAPERSAGSRRPSNRRR